MKNLEKVIPIFWFAVIAVSGCGKEAVVQKVETNPNILWQSDTADVDGGWHGGSGSCGGTFG